MLPRIKYAIPKDDYTLDLIFLNDEKGIFDLKPYINIGDFKQLSDLNIFMKVRIEDGVLTWMDRLDISPDTVYIKSVKQQ
jgi:hypothetical protein